MNWFVVQLLSCVQLFATPWTAACQASLSFTISWSLLKLTSVESVMPSHHPILCCPLLLLLPIFPSIMVFSNELVVHIRWTKYWTGLVCRFDGNYTGPKVSRLSLDNRFPVKALSEHVLRMRESTIHGEPKQTRTLRPETS